MRYLLWMQGCCRLYNDPIETETIVIPVASGGDDPYEDTPEDVIEDIDELSEQLAVHQIISEERHAEILQGVAECQTELVRLSGVQAENPLLTQILNQLMETRAELTTLKSLVDTKLSNPAPNELTPVVTIPESDISVTEVSTDEVPEDSIENPPQPREKKNRFI